jgi:hypothetical protein
MRRLSLLLQENVLISRYKQSENIKEELKHGRLKKEEINKENKNDSKKKIKNICILFLQ